MDTLKTIHSRRSIRAYTDEPVADEHVRTMLEAAMAAPSAGNAQPWRFVVVQDPATLARIPEVNPYAKMAAKAPLAVLVCGDLSQEKFPGFWVQDCSAATQNLLLAAHDLGLGAVWTGIHPLADREQGFRQLFHLPEHVIPLSLVVIGQPAKQPGAKDRFDASKVHRERW